MASGSTKKEKQKRIFLLALLLVFVAIIGYQVLFGGSAPPSQSNSNSNRQTAQITPTKKEGAAPRIPTTKQERDEYFKQLLEDRTPLNLVAISHNAGSEKVSDTRGDPFGFKPPPPPPPPQPQPQPTLSIQPPQLSRQVVAGSPFTVPVIVFGSNFPPDAVIYFNGAAKPTKRVGDNRLSTELLPREYPSQVSIQVDVKSQSEPTKWWSNFQSINISDLQPPQIIYQGRLGAGASIENLAVSSSSLDRNKVIFKGQTIQGAWRLETVDDKYIELFHTQFEVRRRVQLKNRQP